MTNEPNLIQEIRKRQHQEEITLTQMADKLQVDPATLSRIYRGLKSPGVKFLGGVLEAYPDLQEEVALFLSSLVPEVT